MFFFSWVFRVEYGGGLTWHHVSLVPDFGAKCATSSCGLFEGGGAYLAMHVCATRLQCHKCNLLLCGLICGLFGGANLAVHVYAAGLQCHTCNCLCGLFEGGAYLAMCVCATVLQCHTCNLLCCGLFEGANLAMHVCATVLWCHMHNLLLSGLFHFTFSYILHDSVHSYSF